MNTKRLIHTLGLWTLGGADRRADYLKKNKIFADLGNNCSIMSRTIPLYPKLIKIGNNVHIASNVNFALHDVTHVVINNWLKEQGNSKKVKEKIGCIEIGNNVFIGAGTRILYDVKIGNNVIVGANTLINKDVPNNSVVAGVPVRVIGTYEEFINKRMNENTYPDNLEVIGQNVSDDLYEWLWDEFEKKRK